MSKYKKSLIIFSIVILVLVSIFLIYTHRSLIIYERNLVDNYIGYYLKKEGANKVDENLFTISKLEKENANIKDGLKRLYKNASLEYQENKKLEQDGIYVYDVYYQDNLINRVSLKSTKQYKIMGILNSNDWEIIEFNSYFDNGIYNYNISIPLNYKLYINNNLINDEYIIGSKDVDNLEELTKYIEIDKKNIYQINNLVYEPEIKILDEKDNEIDYKINGNNIEINKEFIKVSTLEEAKKYLKEDLDILGLARNYSLYLTDDLNGSSHGLYKLLPFMLEGTELYDRTVSWSKGPDIYMVSDHTLKNPTFTNESLKNFIIYNENAFSVEVHLEKNMVVSYKDKKDILNDKLYFIYYNNGYKWVKEEAI